MVGTYDPAEPLAQLIRQLEKERQFTQEGGQTIDDAMMVSKCITILAQTAMLNKDIREWRRETTNQKTWVNYNTFYRQACREKRRETTTTGRWGHTVAIKKIYGVPTTPPEEHHEAIDNLHTIVQGIQTKNYKLEGLAQSNEVLTSSNTAVMAQLAHMTGTIDVMQTQLKMLAYAPTN